MLYNFDKTIIMMEDNFNVYYSTVCHVCKKQPEETKFCSGCLLIQYCCKNHQKDDWPHHKELCKAVQNILKKTGTNHVYKEAWNNEIVINSWNSLRMSVVCLTELILKRPLSNVESQIFLFPPVCNICHRYEHKKMISCKICKCVMYCSLDHLKIDEKHSAVCKDLKLSFDIDTQRFSYQHKNINFTTFTESLKTVKVLPANIECLFGYQCIELNYISYFYSELLSYSLTLAFAIQESNLRSNSLTVHVVGADSMEVMSIQTLPIIFCILPHLVHLQIVMIGYDLSMNVLVPQEIIGKCSLQIVSNTLYHEYASSDSVIQPDLIIVFNCGFCQHENVPEKDLWKNSFPYIVSFPQCAVTLTSYTYKEASADLKRLWEIKKRPYKIILDKTQNPFRSLYPHRDWETNNESVFYVNNYISLLKIL